MNPTTDTTAFDTTAFDTTAFETGTGTSGITAGGRNRRRIVAVAVAVALGLVAVGAGAVAATSGGGADGRSTALATPVSIPATTVPAESPVDAPADTAGDAVVADEPGAVVPVVDKTPAPSAPAPAPAKPATDPQPEAAPPASPGVLAVSTGLIDLPAGTWAGSFQVRNEGGSPIDWQWAAGAPGITVSHTSGTLQPGEFVDVAFTIDPKAVALGDFVFANCVFTADQAKDVRIEGTKTIVVNPNVPLPELDLKQK